MGTAIVPVQNPRNSVEYTKESGVVEDRFASLLEAEAVQKMNLVVVQHQNILHSDREASKGSELTEEHNINSLTEERVLSEYANVFRGLDKTGGKLHLEVDDKLTPVVIPPGMPLWQLR